MIKPPFANYHRAELERLVLEAFENIEKTAHAMIESSTSWGTPSGYPMDPFEFQVLMAAEKYLQNTNENNQAQEKNSKFDIKPLRKTGKSCSLTLSVSYDKIVEILGFEPNCTDLDDPSKVKASWGFTVDGQECGIWCYKFYGNPRGCDYWSFYGKMETAEKLFGKEALE